MIVALTRFQKFPAENSSVSVKAEMLGDEIRGAISYRPMQKQQQQQQEQEIWPLPHDTLTNAKPLAAGLDYGAWIKQPHPNIKQVELGRLNAD